MLCSPSKDWISVLNHHETHLYFPHSTRITGLCLISIDEADRDKTAPSRHHGLFRFRALPFGLCKAPSTFTLTLNMILLLIQWQFCLLSLDDIMFSSWNAEEHILHVYTVLLLSHKADVSLNLMKCKLRTKRSDYLWHVTWPRRMKLADHNTDAICNSKPLRDGTKLKLFLGLCRVYKWFVLGFAGINGTTEKEY